MSANVDGMIRAAIDAFKKGDKGEARTLLEKAIEVDEFNEKAWLWLSAVVDNPEEQRTCLENVIVINPDNERARKGLQSLGVEIPEPEDEPGPEEPVEASPFTDTSFVDDDAAFDDGDFSAQQEPPSRYVPATSSASANYDEAFDEDDYDSWMDNLKLGMEEDEQDGSFEFDDPSAFDNPDTATMPDDAYFGSDDYGAVFGEGPDAAADEEDGVYSFADYASADVGAFNNAISSSPADDDFSEFALDDDPADTGFDPNAEFEELFMQIPASIRPTHVPGEKSGGSILQRGLTALLVLVNIGAVVFLIVQVVS